MELKMAAAVGEGGRVDENVPSPFESLLPEPEFVSAFSGEGIDALKKRILEVLRSAE